MSRFRRDECAIYVWEAPSAGRFCITWRSATHWDDIRCSLKDTFRGHYNDLRFDSARKAWTLPVWQRPNLDAWLAWYFDPGCVVGEEPARHTYERASSGSSRARTASAAGSAMDAAYSVLHLLPSAPPELVTAAQRILVKLHHPDVGGSHERTVAINQAMDLIRQQQPQTAG